MLVLWWVKPDIYHRAVTGYSNGLFSLHACPFIIVSKHLLWLTRISIPNPEALIARNETMWFSLISLHKLILDCWHAWTQVETRSDSSLETREGNCKYFGFLLVRQLQWRVFPIKLTCIFVRMSMVAWQSLTNCSLQMSNFYEKWAIPVWPSCSYGPKFAFTHQVSDFSSHGFAETYFVISSSDGS